MDPKHYATSSVLMNMWRDEPALSQDLVYDMMEDLEFYYDYSADAFPNKPGLWSSYRRNQWMTIVQEWMDTHDWHATRNKRQVSRRRCFTPSRTVDLHVTAHSYGTDSQPVQAPLSSNLRSMVNSDTQKTLHRHVRPQSKHFGLEENYVQSQEYWLAAFHLP
jgi:hypothetical protein